MFRKLFFGALLSSLLLTSARAHEGNIPESVRNLLGQCQVSIVATPSLRIEKTFKHTDGFHPSCSIEFTSSEHVSNQSIGVLTVPRRMDMDDSFGMGFMRDPDKPGKWLFEGTTDLLLQSRIIKRSFTHESTIDDELLVGHQVLRGYTTKGGPIDIPGVRILRLTPELAIGVELNFDGPYFDQTPKAYKQLRATITAELIDIVRSLRPTPGQPGPVVRKP